LAVIGSCLGVYVVLAVAFHWFVQPSVGKSYGAPAFNAQAVVARPDSVAPLPSPVAPVPPAPSHFAAAPPAAAEATPAVVPPNAAKKYVARKRQDGERRPWDFTWGPSNGYRSNGSRPWF
jgi:predicted lipid-binding transport protein (Tim44 family)